MVHFEGTAYRAHTVSIPFHSRLFFFFSFQYTPSLQGCRSLVEVLQYDAVYRRGCDSQFCLESHLLCYKYAVIIPSSWSCSIFVSFDTNKSEPRLAIEPLLCFPLFSLDLSLLLSPSSCCSSKYAISDLSLRCLKYVSCLTRNDGLTYNRENSHA